MAMIELPRVLYDRLRRLAAADGLTVAQELEKLIESDETRRKLSSGGSDSGEFRLVSED